MENLHIIDIFYYTYQKWMILCGKKWRHVGERGQKVRKTGDVIYGRPLECLPIG